MSKYFMGKRTEDERMAVFEVFDKPKEFVHGGTGDETHAIVVACVEGEGLIFFETVEQCKANYSFEVSTSKATYNDFVEMERITQTALNSWFEVSDKPKVTNDEVATAREQYWKKIHSIQKETDRHAAETDAELQRITDMALKSCNIVTP